VTAKRLSILLIEEFAIMKSTSRIRNRQLDVSVGLRFENSLGTPSYRLSAISQQGRHYELALGSSRPIPLVFLIRMIGNRSVELIFSKGRYICGDLCFSSDRDCSSFHSPSGNSENGSKARNFCANRGARHPGTVKECRRVSHCISCDFNGPITPRNG